MLREGEQTISVPGSFGKELVRQGAGIVKAEVHPQAEIPVRVKVESGRQIR